MPKRDIRTKLALDGEREYKAGVQSVNASIKTLNTEMLAINARYKDNSNSIEALNAKNTVINQQYQEQQKKLELLEAAHKNATKQLGEEDKRTQRWAQSVNIAKKRLSELERQMGEVERDLDPLNRAIEENEDAAKNASNKISYLNSELKALDAQYADNRESTEYLTKKQEILDKQHQESKNRVEALKQALKDIEQQSGKNSEEYMRMEASLNEARAEMYSAESATKNMESQSKSLGDVINDVASKFGIQLPSGITEAIDGLGKFDKKTADTAMKTKSSTNAMSTAISGMSVPIAGIIMAIAAIAVEVGKTAMDVEESSARMRIALDLTGDEAKNASDAVTDVYLNAIVDNRGEAEAAVTAVMRLMGATGDEALDLADKLTVIKEAFGEDYGETARTASTLMKNFGITGEEALDIIVSGLQTSADKNRDLLDVLNEYSLSFARLGNDAESFLTRIVSATDAGAYSADKAADAYKEFYNKAAGQDETFKEALSSLGLHADQIINELLSGGETASYAMEKVVSRLEGVSDTAEQSKIASSLFGSQWEDVGTDAVLAMNDIEGKIIETTGAAAEAVDIMVGTTKKSFKGFWRWFTSWDGIKDWTQLFRVDFSSAAVSSIEGYKEGIEEEKQDAIDAASDAAQDISDAVDEKLDINSPSGVFIDKGIMSMRGYTIGWLSEFEKAQKQISSAMYTMSKSVPDPVFNLNVQNSGILSRGGSQAYGGDSFNITIDVKDIKDLNTIVDIAQKARRARRSGATGRSQ